MKNQYTFDVDLYSDLYKDVHGFRPRGNAWENWITASDDEKQVMWDFLLEDLENVLAAERELEKDNITRFENLVDSLITSGAGDRETAIRWIKEGDADRYDDDYVIMDDPEYFCFRHGLPYDYFSKGPSNEN